jgi:hypothetical protein
MKHVFACIFCIIQMWGASYDFVVSDIDSLYPYSDDDCLHVYFVEPEKSESQIEVVEPEPPEHVAEAMTLFKWEW